MRVTRLYVEHALEPATQVQLGDGAAQHLRRVLRATIGDRVVLFDGSGRDYPAEIVAFDAARVRLRVMAPEPAAAAESPLPITLIQGISRGERMDFVLQKATELGVTELAPVLTERTIVRLDSLQTSRKTAHWRAIMIAACEQCGRAVLPVLQPPVPLAQRLGGSDSSSGAMRAMLSLDGREPLADAVRGASRVELLIGPEGGLSPEERELARASGFVGVTLGPRVLRTETAALAALAIVQQCGGDLGRGRR